MVTRRLLRPRSDRTIAGVCAGIANYLDVDVVLIRALWVVLSIVPGAIIGGTAWASGGLETTTPASWSAAGARTAHAPFRANLGPDVKSPGQLSR